MLCVAQQLIHADISDSDSLPSSANSSSLLTQLPYQQSILFTYVTVYHHHLVLVASDGRSIVLAP